MGGSATIASPGSELSYFFDSHHATGETAVQAIIVWRGGYRDPMAPPLTWSERWRALRAVVRPPPRPPMPAWRLAPEWDGATGMDGPREARVSRSRRVVRVAGEEHPLSPDGRTLVLLVDDRRGDGVAPLVARHHVTIGTVPAGPPSLERSREAILPRLRAQQAAVHALVTALVAADPVIQAFLRGDAPAG